MKLTYTDMLHPNNNWSESTNVFSYFILKLVFLFKYDVFIRQCIDNNKDIYSVTNDDFILSFIKRYHNNKDMNGFLDIFSKTTYSVDTLRMTILEL